MHHWKLAVGLGSSVLLGFASFANANEIPVDELKFSNTQNLGKEEKSFIEKYTPQLVEIEDYVSLVAAPPANSSEETQREMEALLGLQERRNSIDIALIQRQKRFCRFDFPEFSFGQNQKLDALLTGAFLDTSFYIFKLKVLYDRVRPNFLNDALRPAIANPNHPAYPSGHAGQSLIVALILKSVFPERGNAFLSTAVEIGSNRELAGVHYRSDTLAGQEVARKYFETLAAKPLFKERVAEIQREGFDGPPMSVAQCEAYLAKVLEPYRGD